MRTVLISLPFFVCPATPAPASVPHVVQPGETLWQIAANNNFTTRALAAANGLSENSAVIAGTTLKIPSVAEAAAALQGGGITPAASTPSGPAPEPMGGYIVRPGDTLTALAARAGVSVQQMAFMNGRKPDAFLIACSPLQLPTGAPLPTTAAAPRVVTAALDAPTPDRVSASDIAMVASR